MGARGAIRFIAAVVVLLIAVGCSQPPPTYESKYTEPTSPSAAPSRASDVAAVNAALAGVTPYTVSVLGDSTGNAPDEWVHLVAQRIAADYGRQVTVHDWNKDTNSYDPPVVYGEGPPVTVWNASAAGKGTSYTEQWFEQMVPQPADLTVINHSHNDLERAIPGIAGLISRARGVVAVTLQNPRTDQFAERGQSTIDQLREIYRDKAVEIDVNAAFRGHDLSQLLYPDGVHPTEQGSQIWADTVMSALKLR